MNIEIDLQTYGVIIKPPQVAVGGLKSDYCAVCRHYRLKWNKGAIQLQICPKGKA